MLYFLDTEFIEDGHTIDLVSIGIVAEDGREYYAVSTEFGPSKANKWVQENVLTTLPPIPKFVPNEALMRWAVWGTKAVSLSAGEASPYWKPKSVIAQEIIDFLSDDPNPKFWGEWSSYDWIALCQLYGTMMDLPEGWPMRCRDVVQLLEDELELSQNDWPASLETDGNHNALLGARTVKARWEWCQNQKMKRPAKPCP